MTAHRPLSAGCGRAIVTERLDGRPHQRAQTAAAVRAIVGFSPRSLAAEQGRTYAIEVPVADIRPSPFRRATSEARDALEALARDIHEDGGLIEPLVVRTVHGRSGYELVSGEHRWRALQLTPLATALVVVHEELSDHLARRLAAADDRQQVSDSADPAPCRNSHSAGPPAEEVARLVGRGAASSQLELWDPPS